jgi:hypothetical protein
MINTHTATLSLSLDSATLSLFSAVVATVIAAVVAAVVGALVATVLVAVVCVWLQ